MKVDQPSRPAKGRVGDRVVIHPVKTIEGGESEGLIAAYEPGHDGGTGIITDVHVTQGEYTYAIDPQPTNADDELKCAWYDEYEFDITSLICPRCGAEIGGPHES